MDGRVIGPDNVRTECFRQPFWPDGSIKTLLPATRSLEVRAKGKVLVLLCFFVRFFVNDFSTTRGRFTPNFARGRILVPDVSSPLLGVSGPRGAEKGGVNGEFWHFGGF